MTPLREVPQTIEIIPRAVFEEQGATTLSEVLRNVPGITIQAGEGGGASSTTGDMFNMRGFNASNSLFVDNVRDDGLIARDVFNLEQVEVFLGPTGTDVGRGNAAGYVNMSTKMPTPSPAYDVNYGFASGQQSRLTVDVNQPLALGQEDSWLRQTSFRLNGLFQDGGQPGRDLVDNERRAIAPSIGLGIGTPTRVSFAAQIMRQDNLPDYGIPGAAWEEPLTPTAVLAKNPVDQTNYYGSTSAYDYDNIAQDSYTVRLEHDLNPNVTLRNQTRYNNTHRDAVVTASGRVPAGRRDRHAPAAGERPRESNYVEPAERRRARGWRALLACGERGIRADGRRAVRPHAGGARHARPGQHLHAQSGRPDCELCVRPAHLASRRDGLKRPRCTCSTRSSSRRAGS